MLLKTSSCFFLSQHLTHDVDLDVLTTALNSSIFCVSLHLGYQFSLRQQQYPLADLENMKKGDAVSCLAKLIPSEKSKAYNHTGFNVGLAKMMELHCTNLRKTYLTPLRKYISEMEQPKSIENIFKTKQDYSFYEMMEILSNSQYDDICYIEKF